MQGCRGKDEAVGSAEAALPSPSPPAGPPRGASRSQRSPPGGGSSGGVEAAWSQRRPRGPRCAGSRHEAPPAKLMGLVRMMTGPRGAPEGGQQEERTNYFFLVAFVVYFGERKRKYPTCAGKTFNAFKLLKRTLQLHFRATPGRERRREEKREGGRVSGEKESQVERETGETHEGGGPGGPREIWCGPGRPVFLGCSVGACPGQVQGCSWEEGGWGKQTLSLRSAPGTEGGQD